MPRTLLAPSAEQPSKKFGIELSGKVLAAVEEFQRRMGIIDDNEALTLFVDKFSELFEAALAPEKQVLILKFDPEGNVAPVSREFIVIPD